MKKEILLLGWLLLLGACMYGQGKMGASPYVLDPGPQKGVYEAANVPLGVNPDPGAVHSAVLQRYPQLENAAHEFKTEHLITSPGGTHHTLVQQVDGIPLFRSGIKANLDPSGNIYAFMNYLSFAPTQVKGGFVHTAAEAEAWARRNLPQAETMTAVWVEKNYLPGETGLLPVYRVQTDGRGVQNHWEILLDANSLKEVFRDERAIYHRPKTPPMPPTVDGRGFVFLPDPLTSDQTYYLSSWEYQDSSDQVTPALDNARFLVTLKEITEDNGVYTLDGPYVTIQDQENPVIPPATSTNGDFFYQRSQPGFEDVMCYYHIDSVQRHIQTLGFTSLANLPVICDPHGLDSTDNSHFIPPGSGTSGRLAFGQGGVDDAEDADVIVHEYGHALSHYAAPGSNSGFERRGLDEGYGDYVAAMWSYGMGPFRWGDIFTWDGHNEFWDGRTSEATYTYPPPTGQQGFYPYGELWATVLMEAYNHPDIGKWVNNRCVFQSMYGNALNGTLADAAKLVLKADSLFYGEAHEAIYRDLFCSKGILTGQQCVVITSVDALGAGLGIGVYPNPASEYVNLSIEGFQPGLNLTLEIRSLTGQLLMESPVQSANERFETSRLPAGLYLLQVRNETGILKTEKLVIQ